MGGIAEGAKEVAGREEEGIEARVAAVLLMITGEEDREAMEDREDLEVVRNSSRDLRFNTEDQDTEGKEDLGGKEDSEVKEGREDSEFRVDSGVEDTGDDMDE